MKIFKSSLSVILSQQQVSFTNKMLVCTISFVTVNSFDIPWHVFSVGRESDSIVLDEARGSPSFFMFVEDVLPFCPFPFMNPPLPPSDHVLKDGWQTELRQDLFHRMGTLIYFADKDCG